MQRTFQTRKFTLCLKKGWIKLNWAFLLTFKIVFQNRIRISEKCESVMKAHKFESIWRPTDSWCRDANMNEGLRKDESESMRSVGAEPRAGTSLCEASSGAAFVPVSGKGGSGFSNYQESTSGVRGRAFSSTSINLSAKCSGDRHEPSAANTHTLPGWGLCQLI